MYLVGQTYFHNGVKGPREVVEYESLNHHRSTASAFLLISMGNRLRLFRKIPFFSQPEILLLEIGFVWPLCCLSGCWFHFNKLNCNCRGLKKRISKGWVIEWLNGPIRLGQWRVCNRKNGIPYGTHIHHGLIIICVYICCARDACEETVAFQDKIE